MAAINDGSGGDWFDQVLPPTTSTFNDGNTGTPANPYVGPYAPGVDPTTLPGYDPSNPSAGQPGLIPGYNVGGGPGQPFTTLPNGTGAYNYSPGPSTPNSPYGPLNAPYGGTMPSVSQYTPPPFSYDPFTAPAAFAPPSAQDVLNNDPGYGFRLGQGTQALEQSAAARGTLNTGGTLQDLVNYGQNYASNEYGNAYNQALGTYQTNFADALNAYQTNFGGALAQYNTNYSTQYANPYAALMGQYNVNDANFTGAQDRAFGQQFATATA